MRKIYNKEQLRTSPDYLNFIRRNQQIVREFKEITQIESKSKTLKKMYPGNPENPKTLEVDRYSDSHRQNGPRNSKVTSLRDIIPSFVNSRGETPIVNRKTNPSDGFNAEIYTRNFGIPTNKQKTLKDSLDHNDGSDEVKLPKLSSRLSQNDQRSISERSNSSECSLEKEIVEPKSATQNKNLLKRSTDRSSEWQYLKKNYAPISLDNSKKQGISPRCKVKSMKFADINKTKLNNQLIRTYYDYENLVELKDRVFELLPTFKPLQTKKKDKVQIVQFQQAPGELQQFLEANMIQKPISQAIQTKVIKKQSMSARQEDYKYENGKRIQSRTTEGLQAEKISTNGNTNFQKKYSSTSPTKNKKKPIILPNPKNSELTVYQNKIASYREFLFLINFAHRVFHPLLLKEDTEKCKTENKYKYYLGKGNNSLLVKSLMKRRFWWTEVDDPKAANFVWTQLKINTYYQFQPKSDLSEKFDKLDEDHIFEDLTKKKFKKNKVKLDLNKKSESPTKVGGILRGQLPENEKKVFTNADNLHLALMLSKATEENPELKNFQRFQNRLKYLPEGFLKKIDLESLSEQHVHNHFSCNYQIGNKKAMFYNLKHYYEVMEMNPWNTLPLTFHIKKGMQDPQFAKFSKQFKRIKNELMKAEKSNASTKKLSKNVWIIKPGELSNRGNGITVVDEMYEINSILKKKEKHTNGQEKTYIIQKYIEKPLLYKSRKFDIRHYMMISRLHGRMRAYWFSEGYIRTSCYEYDIQEVGDEMIHLTNDAIQKHCPAYGKYEEGNKLSYAEFQRYLDNTYPDKKYSFLDQIYPRMKEIATDAIKSTYLWMDPDQSQHNFEIFGLDFMIDSQFAVWLIEVNTNPCLEISSQLLSRIIPTMVQNSLRLGLDPLFPPPAHYINSIKYLAPDNPMERLQYQLIFDESRDGKEIEDLLMKAGKADCGEIDEEDETYEDNGKEIDLGGDLE